MIRVRDINEMIEAGKADPSFDANEISDGYHEFGELYQHRVALHIALCKVLHYHTFADDGGSPVFRTLKNYEGEEWKGWFILGFYDSAGKQITYHIPISKWDECDFARTLEKNFGYDGHNSSDVIERLKNL